MKNNIEITESLIEAIRSYPLTREVFHCDKLFIVSPFDLYAICPKCQQQIKTRSFSSVGEIEDIFDAVFEWMMQPTAQTLVLQRQEIIKEDME